MDKLKLLQAFKNTLGQSSEQVFQVVTAIEDNLDLFDRRELDWIIYEIQLHEDLGEAHDIWYKLEQAIVFHLLDVSQSYLN